MQENRVFKKYRINIDKIEQNPIHRYNVGAFKYKKWASKLGASRLCGV